MFKTNIFSLALIFMMIISACAQPPIKVEHFKEYVEIKTGEEAHVFWNFQNADKVTIDGIERLFNNIDSVRLLPDKTEFYTVTAYQDNKDSLKLNCVVHIIEELEETEISELNKKEIQRGPVLFQNKKLTSSFEKSKYLSGIAETKGLTTAKSLKLIRSINPNGDDYYLLRAIPIDEFGNFLSGYGDFNMSSKWSVSRTCKNINDETTVDEFHEQSLYDITNLDIGIALDNSDASAQSYEVIQYIKEFIQYLSPDDNVLFSTFNQDYIQMFALSPPEKALWELGNVEPAASGGLTSLNKAAFKTIEKLGEGYYDERICIIITYSSDNSSVLYTANDIAKLSKESGIPIYIIGIGNAVESYTLRFISHSTGGRFYHIMENEIQDLTKILIEIAIAQKAYYEFSVSTDDAHHCDVINTTLTFDHNDAELSDNIKLIQNPIVIPVKYQALASFDKGETFIKQEFENTLNSLAFILQNNPDFKIQLIGHSGQEGSDDENMDMSVQRALNIRAYLTTQGSRKDQIEVRGEADRKPLYYLGLTDWQNKYNRRVEIRWLDPKLQPFEIKAEILESEEDALNATRDWEKKGFQAYYDRYIINKTSMYQVRLWGFSTKQQAKETASSINKNYNVRLSVE